ENGHPPELITYFTGELIDDHHALVRIITDSLLIPNNISGKTEPQYLLLDEITYINNWDKGVKYRADSGFLENIVMVLTGSDLVVIKEARMRFPGRRGISDTVDFQLFPLSFYEYVKLNNRITNNEICALVEDKKKSGKNWIDILYEEFEKYMMHGGFLTAINDMAIHNRIFPATFSTYSDWIRGDMLKRNKHEHNLMEIIGGVIKRYGSQITWNSLSKDLSIDHPKTIADYIGLLESMDVLYVQPALLEDKLAAAPKKARKVIFSDPFIYHALNAWLHPCKDPYEMLLKPQIESAENCGRIVESCIVNHYQRKFPTFYIKAKGEVDIAYIDQKRFWPIEVKWTRQLRPKELKQISKYPNSKILTKNRNKGEIQGIPTEPVPLNLLCLGYTTQ
ncbi:MAG: ATP-binding protein, partial [Desulfobacterales bacterium]|nr:ATP-binding protein [Desulfobacterales bacterium]